MNNGLTYNLIKTAVKNGIRYIEDNPRRGVRNLLDLGEYFATGRFQKEFFDIAHDLLINEESPYYEMVERLIRQTRHETLADFGTNLGYNSFTRGAGEIRELEAKKDLDIPWTIVLDFTEPAPIDQTARLIVEGKHYGIYTYLIFLGHEADMLTALIPLMIANPDCAFVVLLHPSIVDDGLALKLGEVTNLLIALEWTGEPEQAQDLLKEQACLYASWRGYDDDNYREVLSGQLRQAEVSGSSILFLVASPTCGDCARQIVSEDVLAARKQPLIPVFAVELYSDILRVDGIISDSPRFMAVDTAGRIVDQRGEAAGPAIFSVSLDEAFAR